MSAALIAVIIELYGDQFQCLVLAGGPERLGECGGLQDALAWAGRLRPQQRHRAVRASGSPGGAGRPAGGADEVPLILVDAERGVDVLCQFPLWLAFAAGPGERLDDDDLL